MTFWGVVGQGTSLFCSLHLTFFLQVSVTADTTHSGGDLKVLQGIFYTTLNLMPSAARETWKVLLDVSGEGLGKGEERLLPCSWHISQRKCYHVQSGKREPVLLLIGSSRETSLLHALTPGATSHTRKLASHFRLTWKECVLPLALPLLVATTEASCCSQQGALHWVNALSCSWGGGNGWDGEEDLFKKKNHAPNPQKD